MERFVELVREGVERTGDLTGYCRASIAWGLAALGRFEEARPAAIEAVSVAESTGDSGVLSYALAALGRSLDSDPPAALTAFRRSVEAARSSGNTVWEEINSRDMTIVEATHGRPEEALVVLDGCLEAFSTGQLRVHEAVSLGCAAILLSRLGMPAPAAVLFGVVEHDSTARAFILQLDALGAGLAVSLGPGIEQHLAYGRAMTLREAVLYAHEQIAIARQQLATESGTVVP